MLTSWRYTIPHVITLAAMLDYDELLLNGTLDDHVAEIDRQAEEMFDRMIKQIAVKRGITEHLKCEDQTAWVSAMNQIRGISKEVVLNKLLYC